MSASSFDLVFGPIEAASSSERIRTLFRYWNEIAGGGVPCRDEIDPSRLKPLLPHILLVDLEGEPFRVRYRLVGTEVVLYSGMEFTGRYLDELMFDDFVEAELLRSYRMVREARKPGFGRATLEVAGHTALNTEYLICPLRGDSVSVDKCIVVEEYFLRSGALVNELPPVRIKPV